MADMTARFTLARCRRFAERLLASAFAVLALLALVVTLLWRDRAELDDVPLSPAPTEITAGEGVTVTWFGVTTLLFDDGDTQILIDGFISRPGIFDLVLDRPVGSDVAGINRFLIRYDIRRLAAIIPVHSHFDHALDIGAVANRTGASILGSTSSGMIARGAGVPDDQVIVVDDAAEYTFGSFTVRLLPMPHAPIGWGGEVPLRGTIDAPLSQPAPISSFREGGGFAVVISHPTGEALVLGSAGIDGAALADLHVDTVFLGVGMLESLGRDYLERYWQAAVTSTGATTIVPVHFDDYTRPFGEIRLAPKQLDDFAATARAMRELRQQWDRDSRVYLPAFGTPMPLLTAAPPET